MQTDENDWQFVNGRRMIVHAKKCFEKAHQVFRMLELLAILIGSGKRGWIGCGTCAKIMRECDDNINELARLTIADLCKNLKALEKPKP